MWQEQAIHTLKLTPTLKACVCLTCFLQAHRKVPPFNLALIQNDNQILYICSWRCHFNSWWKAHIQHLFFFFFLAPERALTFRQMKTDSLTPCTPDAKCQSFQTSTLQCNRKKKSSTWSYFFSFTSGNPFPASITDVAGGPTFFFQVVRPSVRAILWNVISQERLDRNSLTIHANIHSGSEVNW